MPAMRSTNGQKKNNDRFWSRHASGYTKSALENTVTFPMFSVKETMERLFAGRKLESCKSSEAPPLDTAQYWDGSAPRVAADRDGIPMVVYLPGLHQSHRETTGTAMNLLYQHQSNSIRSHASNSRGRNKQSNFVGEQQGTLECGVISEQGHPNHTPRPAFSNTGKTVNYFDEMSAVNASFECSREAMNGVLYIIDQDWYSVLQDIREKLKNRSSGVRAHQTLDPSLLPSHTLSWNRSIDLHSDQSDYPRGWSGFHATGNYTEGGELWIPALNLKIRFLPGDFILIRGALLEHAILPFKGGDRYADTSYLPAAFVRQDEKIHERARTAPLLTVHGIINQLAEAQTEKDARKEKEKPGLTSHKKRAHKKKLIVNRSSMREEKLKHLTDTFDRHRKK